MSELDRADIQGLVFSGYGNKPHAFFVFANVVNGARAREWLGRAAERVTTGAQVRTESNLNVALTAKGLAALGLSSDALRTFPREFVEGIAGSEKRSQILGDDGESHPERWLWGGKDKSVDLVLMIYGETEIALARALELEREAFAGALESVYDRSTEWLAERREHFGFVDGVAQPSIKGVARSSGPSSVELNAGEFVLGYPNEYDKLPLSPSVRAETDRANVLPTNGDGSRRDLGRNGSYVVFRQMNQHVATFWRTMKARAGGSEDEAVRLASKCVGRWPSGAPLVLTPDHDDPAFSNRNDFLYAGADPHGYACPIGAHIRRTNPRDSLVPEKDSLKVSNRHAILRRGRSYGPPLDRYSTEDDGRERGLLFACLNANIARQFEFLQQTWVINPKFGGLYEDRDPLLGNHEADGGIFTIPERPVRRRLTGLPRFTTIRGGGYFFLPGIRALRYLADSRAA